jgi:hypothetical protein
MRAISEAAKKPFTMISEKIRKMSISHISEAEMRTSYLMT